MANGNNPNWETEKFAKTANNAKQMWDQLKGTNARKINGDPDDPRMFFDNDGFLHIVIDKDDWVNKVTNFREPKGSNSGEHNEEKGYADGEGIYIHVISSPPVNKVCPCKLDPNASCE